MEALFLLRCGEGRDVVYRTAKGHNATFPTKK